MIGDNTFRYSKSCYKFIHYIHTNIHVYAYIYIYDLYTELYL